MSNINFPKNKCSISDDWNYKGMQVVYMENDFIRVGILAGRGSDIFEFTYKPRAVDFMCRLSKEIENPNLKFSQLRDTGNQLEDYYYGGWQEALPNSKPFHYRGASLGQHGEVSLIPWKHSIIKNDPDCVSLRLSVRPLRVPVYLEKTLTLTHDSAKLIVEEKLINESETELDLMWGHHIAFGLPFLEKGARLITNASKCSAEPLMPNPRIFEPSVEFDWPLAKNQEGEDLEADIIPKKSSAPYSELAYLSDFPKDAFYALWNEDEKLGFSVHWDAQVFKSLWFWQERYASQNAPWWGSAYAVGLEPWTAKWSDDPEASIRNGDWLKLKPHEICESKLEAGAIVEPYNP